MLNFDFATASDRGLVRKNNEDSAYAGPHLLALADGMGGHAAGEVASQLMINSIKQLDGGVETLQSFGADSVLGLMAEVAAQANKAIADGVRENPDTDGMGTTLTTLLLHSTDQGTELGMCHVGDSRAYRVREGKLEQITVDDTFVQSLVNEGKLDPSEVSTHPQRSLILKAYTGRPVEPTLRMVDVRPGDRFLLCSDGLSDPVSFETIQETLPKGTPADAARQLISLALRGGGPDNVTVVVADVKEGVVEKPSQLAGAINGDQPEDPRPDTAAGRAAMVQVRNSVAARSPQAVGAPVEPIDEKKSKRGLIISLCILAILVIIIGGAYPATNAYAKNKYYLSTDSGQIVIMNGLNHKLGSWSFTHLYQKACLNASGDIKVIDADSENTSAGCSPFSYSDLNAEGRKNFDSSGSYTYDGVVEKLRELGAQTLPICVVRQSTNALDGHETTQGTSPEDLMTPGVSCRIDLTEPSATPSPETSAPETSTAAVSTEVKA
ncbi:MAG: protein phosphatase 2C domain-containing protein [Corynebacterium sp.]|nr:protein phosphatase 2C domain-containing protein [Corynebacterium sp.]